MKSLMLLFQETLIDLGVRCCVSTTLDQKTVESRFEHEGLSFLTITLSKFGKDFQKSLDQGFVGHDQFSAFSKAGSLPRFFGGFFDQVFDRSSGRLLSVPNIDSIYAILQLTALCQKIELECTETRTRAAYTKYMQCESELKESDKLFPSLKEDFQRIGRLLWADVFSTIDNKIYHGELIPKHGSGATADKLMGNQKYYQQVWHTRLEQYFPAMEYLLPSWNSYELLEAIEFREPGDEHPAQLDAVPKTLETPRLIAKEPTCMQYTQQAVLESIVDAIEDSYEVNSLIGWGSAIPNNHLAMVGSRDGSFATLDLSEASDRVSNQHVLALLENHPHLREAVQSCRSRKVDVPGHGVIRVAKFASMGSALCFPFESFVFMTIIFLAIEQELNRPLTGNDIKRHLGKVRTYGDDIIVPTRYALCVSQLLETFGYRVNSNKSFWTGKFRESCGKWYYDGVDVTPIRIRSVLPTTRRDAEEIISILSFRNQMYLSGNWGVVRYVDALVDSFQTKFGFSFPVVLETSPSLGRISHLGFVTHKWDPHLQRPLIKGAVVETPLPRNEVNGVHALLKFFLKRGDLPVADRNHLTHSGRPRSTNIKTRWTTPF